MAYLSHVHHLTVEWQHDETPPMDSWNTSLKFIRWNQMINHSHICIYHKFMPTTSLTLHFLMHDSSLAKSDSNLVEIHDTDQDSRVQHLPLRLPCEADNGLDHCFWNSTSHSCRSWFDILCWYCTFKAPGKTCSRMSQAKHADYTLSWECWWAPGYTEGETNTWWAFGHTFVRFRFFNCQSFSWLIIT